MTVASVQLKHICLVFFFFVQFRTYTFKAGKGGSPVPLILCDTMGLEESADAGLDPDDVINICQGHVQDRYQVQPTSCIMFMCL